MQIMLEKQGEVAEAHVWMKQTGKVSKNPVTFLATCVHFYFSFIKHPHSMKCEQKHLL